MSTLQRAIEISVEAHSNQMRKNGDPYILHPLRVMFRQSTPETMIVAVLHDVVEDTSVNLDDLRDAGFSPVILDAVALLTHGENDPYEIYIDRIASNPLARSVKLADLEDNMNLRELPEVHDYDLERTKKYHSAWNRLGGGGA